MARNTRIQLFELGKLVPRQMVRGSLGAAHSGASAEQLATAVRIGTDPASFARNLKDCVICADDRLCANGQRMHAPRLAGGGLSLALMRNLLLGGTRLSLDLQELRTLGFHLVLHDYCGALSLAPQLIPQKLSDTNASGYHLLRSLGMDVPTSVCRRIAEWAKSLPKDYFDTAASMRVVNEVEPIVGEHNAVLAAISMVEGESFTYGPQLYAATDGLMAFAFDPWAATRAAERIAVSQSDVAAATMLALIFTAQVFLELGGPDLRVITHQ